MNDKFCKLIFSIIQRFELGKTQLWGGRFLKVKVDLMLLILRSLLKKVILLLSHCVSTAVIWRHSLQIGFPTQLRLFWERLWEIQLISLNLGNQRPSEYHLKTELAQLNRLELFWGHYFAQRGSFNTHFVGKFRELLCISIFSVVFKRVLVWKVLALHHSEKVWLHFYSPNGFEL